MKDKNLPDKVKIVPSNKDYNILNIGKGGQPDIKSKSADLLINLATELSGAEMSDQSVDIIKNYINNSVMGFTSVIPMKCTGETCPFLNQCPLKLAGSKLPVNSACPVERILVANWVTKHLKSLGIEDINDPENSFDMDLLYELAGQELIRWRCGIHLSDDPALVSRQHINTTLNGDQIFADVINPVLEVMERAGKNIQKIREALVATRESQIKAGQESKDASQKASELRARALAAIEQKRKSLSRLDVEIIKDAEIIERDK